MLPIEIKAEILKSFSTQRRISKILNQYNKQLFNDQFAALPISQYEILKYVKDHDIILFSETIKDGLSWFMIHHIIKSSHYKIHSYNVIYNNNIQIMPGLEDITRKNMDFDDITTYIKKLKGDIYCDLYSTYQIITNRHMDAKDYTIKENKKYTKEINVNNIHTTFQLLKKLIYIDINDEFFTFNGTHIDIGDIVVHHDRITNILFNEGLMDKQDILEFQALENYYGHWQDVLINKIKNF